MPNTRTGLDEGIKIFDRQENLVNEQYLSHLGADRSFGKNPFDGCSSPLGRFVINIR